MRVLSGITPSGECHVGNYFGAMRQHVELQDGNEAIYFMADYHSMNSVRDASERRRLVREGALDYLACGLDPERAIINVENYMEATGQLAQTTLRSVLGQHELDDMLSERAKLNADIQEILDQRTNEFKILKGPIFTNLLLADEINRAAPKVQGALLEAMQEKTVTIC